MATFGGTYSSPTLYVPAFRRAQPGDDLGDPRKDPLVTINPTTSTVYPLVLDRAFNPDGTPVKSRKRINKYPPVKRPTQLWHGLTDESLIPATPAQRKAFATSAERN
jgi:hypothetical protein